MSSGAAAAANPKQMSSAVATATMAAAGTHVIARWVIKASPPLYRPALFSFLIELASHWQDPPLKIQGKGMKQREDAWALPGQLGWYTGGADGGFVWRTPELSGRAPGSSGFYQAFVSGAITAVVWYVAARGFFNSKHRAALWYAGVFGIIGAYGGYLQGDQQDITKRSTGAPSIRLPWGGGFGRKP